MRPSLTLLRGTALLLLAAVVAGALVTVLSPTPGVRRRFMPGALGAEPGTPAPPPTARAYLTRAFTGVDEGEAATWAAENGIGPALAFSHHLAEIFPPALAATRPEFFPLINGGRLRPGAGAANWNPDLGRADVAAWTADTARRHFEANPGEVSFAIGVNDGLLFGESAETLAGLSPPRWFRGRPDYTPLVYTFANRVAADVARTHPGKWLGTLAYYWCEQAPDFPVHPQLLPFLTADRTQGYDAAWRSEERALQQRWARSGVRRLGLYDYLYGQGFLVPRVVPGLIAENIREARRLGFTDYFAEMNPNWGLDGPQPWLVAQLLQDPEASVAVLLDEYYTRYFREAAAPMRRFFGRAEAQWLSQPGPAYWLKHFRNESQATLFPSTVVAEMRAALDEARRLARSEPVRSRVRLVSEAFRVTERFVAFHEARVVVSRWLAAPDSAVAEGSAALARYRTQRLDFIRTAQAVTGTWAYALAPINYDDFMRNDPTFAAVAALPGVTGDSDVAAAHAVVQAWRNAAAAGRARERLDDGSLEGVPLPAERIAGLDYGIGLPAGWVSRVEPTQAHRAGMSVAAARTGLQGLEVAGATNTTFFRWLPVTPGALYVAAVHARGRVGVSAAVTLLLGWLDASHRGLGTVAVHRMPEGEWPDWQRLLQGARAPEGAAWVGIGVRLQNQQPGDAVQFDDFSLTEVVEK